MAVKLDAKQSKSEKSDLLFGNAEASQVAIFHGDGPVEAKELDASLLLTYE